MSEKMEKPDEQPPRVDLIVCNDMSLPWTMPIAHRHVQALLHERSLGGVDGFDQDEACCECDNGCEISLRLLAS